MPSLLTQLIIDSKLDIDIKLESADLPKQNENAGVTFKMKGLEGSQRITMNTSALESKVQAFKLLNLISESMGAAFQPYTENVLPIVVENMGY